MQPKTDLDPTAIAGGASDTPMPDISGAGGEGSPLPKEEAPAPKTEKEDDDKKDSKLQGIEVLMNNIEEDMEKMEGDSKGSSKNPLESAEPPGDTSKGDPLSMMKENGSGMDSTSKELGGGSESGLAEEAAKTAAQNPELVAAAL